MKLTKAEAVAQALHDGFAPSNQIPPWRIAGEELKERSRLYAVDFERFLLEYGYRIVPVGGAALEAKPQTYSQAVEPYAAALRMVRDAIEELFGPAADLESEDAVLLRGPEPKHQAEALIAALQRVAEKRGGSE